jgi:hypothetical protein
LLAVTVLSSRCPGRRCPRWPVLAAGRALEAAHRLLITAAHLAAAQPVAHLAQRAFQLAQRFGAGAAPAHLAEIAAALLRARLAAGIAVAAGARRVAEDRVQAFQAALGVARFVRARGAVVLAPRRLA